MEAILINFSDLTEESQDSFRKSLRSFDAITSWSIEVPDCPKRQSMMDVDDFPKISDTTESNATLQTVRAF